MRDQHAKHCIDDAGPKHRTVDGDVAQGEWHGERPEYNGKGANGENRLDETQK